MDTYQPIYDAAKRALSGTQGTIAEACRTAFDISWQVGSVKDEFMSLAYTLQKPSVIYKPTLSRDGDHWCVLFGKNLQTGVAGFGKSPDEAMEAFNGAWFSKLPAKEAR